MILRIFFFFFFLTFIHLAYYNSNILFILGLDTPLLREIGLKDILKMSYGKVPTHVEQTLVMNKINISATCNKHIWEVNWM